MDLQPLRIAMYTPQSEGGHALYTRDLLEALSDLRSDSGVTVDLVTSRDLKDHFRSSRYMIHDILPPLAPKNQFATKLHWAVSRIGHYLKSERHFLAWVLEHPEYDGIHFQIYTSWLEVQHFRKMKRNGRRLYFTVHNIYPHIYPPLIPKRWVDNWNRQAWRMCDGLFVHTAKLKDALAQFLGPDHPPIFVTPHGVFRGSTIEPTSHTQLLQKPNRLLFFGIIRRNKGLHVLLDAMRYLPECTLTVAGALQEHNYDAELNRILMTLPPGQVDFRPGFVDEADIPVLFFESSLVVLPYTDFPSQSGVLHLALSYGIPVVATDVGGMRETVEAGGIGQIVPPGDALALSEAVRVALDPTVRAEACAATVRMKNELTWGNAAKRTINGYRQTHGR